MSIDLKQFLTKENFSEKIESKVLNDGCSYFDAIIEFAEDCDKSPEELIPYFSAVLLDKVKKSASDSGRIDLKESTLDEFLN